MCFVQDQGQKTEQKHTTKNFDDSHSHSPRLTMPHPKIFTIPTAPVFQVIFTTRYETIPLFVHGISISLFMVGNQLGTLLIFLSTVKEYKFQRNKSAFHGGRVGKLFYLKLWRRSLVLDSVNDMQ